MSLFYSHTSLPFYIQTKRFYKLYSIFISLLHIQIIANRMNIIETRF